MKLGVVRSSFSLATALCCAHKPTDSKPPNVINLVTDVFILQLFYIFKNLFDFKRK
jgi:hypothetical protein